MVRDSRIIAAILAADVVGYSRLMGADEAGTIASLRVRRTIFEELVDELGGRQFGSVGDSLMAEFPSAVNAVSAALAIQERVAAENAPLPAARRMQLRIGINLGDVIEERGNVFGDAVNVAARLQALARPGGIVISGPVYEQVHLRLPARFIKSGTRHVQGIREAVQTYEVLQPARPGLAGRITGFLAHLASHRIVRATVAVLAVGVVVGLALFWRPVPMPAADHRVPVSPDRSIAVLPFESLTPVDSDIFLAGGIHADILTQLTRIGAFRVIARTSVEQFRDTRLTTQQIGQTLRVARLVRGSVQRVGERVRINVQLIDAASDAIIWAEGYDRTLTAENIFAIQSDVAGAIAATLQASLTPEERRSVEAVRTRDLNAWQAYQLGMQRLARRNTDALADAATFFQMAIDSDPSFALAWAGLASALTLQAQYDHAPHASTLELASRPAEEALRLDPTLAEAWTASALIASEMGRHGRAEQMYRRAIELSPGYATAHQWYGYMLVRMGRLEQAQDQLELAVALDPLSAIVHKNLAEALEGRGRFAAAEQHYKKSIEIEPSMPGPYLGLGNIWSYARARFDVGELWLTRAVSRDPHMATARAGLAFLYIDAQHRAATEEHLKGAMRLGPRVTLVLDAWAIAHLYQNDQAAAIRYATKAVEIHSRDSMGLMLLRDVDLKAGNPAAARARYETAFPELLSGPGQPRVDGSNWFDALQFALVLLETERRDHADQLLERCEQVIGRLPRLGLNGFGLADARIHALRGDSAQASNALRRAWTEGWQGPVWRYYRDFDPALASIRQSPEFQEIFQEIERQVGTQRAVIDVRRASAQSNGELSPGS